MEKKSRSFSEKKILIIGGSGFIGSNLLKNLTSHGAELVSLSRVNKAPFPGITHYNVDINQYNQIDKFIKTNYDIIFHCAGYSDHLSFFKKPGEVIQNNLTGTLNILNSIKKNKAKSKLILLGSKLEYGKPKYLPVDENHPTMPISAYSIEKLASTLFALNYYRLYKIPCVVLRISNVYGPHGNLSFKNYNVINSFIDRAKKKKDLIIYGDGKQLCDYIYIDDLVGALISVAISDETNGEIYNVGCGLPIVFKDFVKLIARKAGVKNVYHRWPKWRLLTKVGSYYSDISKISLDCSWFPKISYERGIDLCLKHSD